MVENNPYPQTTTVTPKTSKAAVASLVCGILGLCLLVPSLFGGILGIIALVKINQSQGSLKGTGLAIGGLATSALSIITAGILASMLLPALARAKAKANRIKCVNNLGSIGRALQGFADDNGQRLPWQLNPIQQQNHFGEAGMVANSAAQIVNIAAMRSELQTPKILVSPSDPERMAGNEMLQTNWQAASEMEIAAGLSYAFAAPGGDVQRPSTVLALTRNIRTDLNSDWIGADEPGAGMNPNVMAGLNKSQGQLVLADGSAKQSTNADLGMSGKITQAHINSRGGVAKGNASTAVLR